jgi:hypothetical protein
MWMRDIFVYIISVPIDMPVNKIFTRNVHVDPHTLLKSTKRAPISSSLVHNTLTRASWMHIKANIIIINLLLTSVQFIHYSFMHHITLFSCIISDRLSCKSCIFHKKLKNVLLELITFVLCWLVLIDI